MSAIISPCGQYRYRLEREVGGLGATTVIMVNPSTADASVYLKVIGVPVQPTEAGEKS